jgi:hypothetical protein
MVGQKTKLLNLLEKQLPDGLLADGPWFDRHGISRQLRNHYVAAGWLEQPARGVYRRPSGSLHWQQAVISLQTILEYSPLAVGGRTALDLQGFAHYLSVERSEVHLYGPKPPPGWLAKLPSRVRFVYHNSRALFRNDPLTRSFASLDWNAEPRKNTEQHAFGDLTVQSWGQSDWPLTLSSPERAILELLDQLPQHESFEQVDKLMGTVTQLSPRRLQKLLHDCSSVKVKRLFFFFADRHQHPWLKHLDKAEVDFGTGKRMLVKGGKLDRAYQITVPGDLDAA